MDELLELIKKFEKIANRDYWLVAYTDGTIEVHNDHKAIISTKNIEEAKMQLKERM
jgi:Cu2+-containing amine oxidase